MKFDIFFSICQTEVDGFTPSEKEMFTNFFDQIKAADELGYEIAWIAESHLSCQTQKKNPNPVIPHFKGEVGLNTDILQLGHKIFANTKKISIGSAIRNILCNGGPIAHAEALKTFMTLHSLNSSESRKIYLGFAAGRFPFSNIPYGIKPRNQLEEAAWPALKGQIFHQATEIFLKALLNKELSPKDISPIELKPFHFRSEDDWQKIKKIDETNGSHSSNKGESIAISPFWDFPSVGVIPFEAPLSLLQLVVGSHDSNTQELANAIHPCWIFNLSITPDKKIHQTHERMKEIYKNQNRSWQRSFMPRTSLIFLNADESLSSTERTFKAKKQAINANENYWRALEGTLDPSKIKDAVENSVYGNPEEVIAKLKEKYHPEDRLMLWFDFNNHNSNEIINSMTAFKKLVEPELK